MWWLLIVILANVFYALAFVIDKYIVSRALPHPIVYTFYVGILSIGVLILIPFGFNFPSFEQLIFALLAGLAQIIGYIFLYKALHLGEVSRIIPFIGGFLAIFTFILASSFIGERLTGQQFIAFILLVVGGLILSIKKGVFFKKRFALAILAALAFAILWVINKYLFMGASFISAIVWIRTATAIIALFLLIPKKNRKKIFKKTEKLKKGTVKYVISGRILSVLGALGIYVAVFLGSVVLVNSLQGIQYVFIMILALILFKKFPKLKEQFNKEVIFQKILAIILIGIGLILLI